MTMRRLILLATTAHVWAEDDPVDISHTFREGIRKPHLSNLEASGDSISIMCVGESGLGKTSLLSSLFQTELAWPEDMAPSRASVFKQKNRVQELSVPFDLDGMPFMAKLIDTPGYGKCSKG